MDSMELKTYGKDDLNLVVSLEYDPDKNSPNYFEVSFLNGDIGWLFDNLEDAVDLAKALEKAMDKCFEFIKD